MREQADTKTKTENRGRARLLRAAAVSIGVVLFLFAFRPFGLTVDSAAEVLVLPGVAPINFLLMLMIHALPLRAEPWRAVVAIGILVVGTTAAPKTNRLSTKHKPDSSRFTPKKPNRATPQGPV